MKAPFKWLQPVRPLGGNPDASLADLVARVSDAGAEAQRAPMSHVADSDGSRSPQLL